MKPIDIPTSADTRIRIRISDSDIDMRSQEELRHHNRLVWVNYDDVKVSVKLSDWAAFIEAINKVNGLLMLK